MSNLESFVKQKMGRRDLLKPFRIRRGECPDEMISCQNELDLLNEKQTDEILKKPQHVVGLKRPYLDERNALIRTIPQFWVKAIKSHPQLCLLLDDEVTEVLRYMTNIEIEDAVFHENRVTIKIHFSFNENPYIENNTLTKGFSMLRGEGKMKFETTSTKIIWKCNQEVSLTEETSSSDSSKRKKNNFFVWFCDNEKPNSDKYYLLIVYFQLIFQNPLPFFYGCHGDKNKKTRNRTGADDHECLLAKEVESINLNDENDGEVNVG